MLFEGEIVNGSIVMDEAVPLPEGTRIRVEPIVANPVRKPIASLQAIKEKLKRDRENPPPPGPTLAERMKDYLRHEIELPPDAASNVDYYLIHGIPEPGAKS